MGVFKNNTFKIGRMTGARTGISLPADCLEGNTFEIGEVHGVERVVEVRDLPSIAQRLGLPADAPAAAVVELLKLALAAESPRQLSGSVEHSAAWKYFGRVADLATVATALWDRRHEASALIAFLLGG